ncbi:MAG: hypothetical protein WCK09_03465 [Bacteroidota bacterium]
MKKLFLFLLTVLLGYGIQAQNIKLPTSTDVKKAEQSAKSEAGKVTEQANIGSVISQLTSNISDDALTSSFKKNKGDFISKTNNVKDAAGASSALQSLQGGLLPTAMDAGWGSVKDKWVKDAKTASTVKTVAGLAGTLESNISDKYFKGSWASARPAWQAALSTLSK